MGEETKRGDGDGYSVGEGATAIDASVGLSWKLFRLPAAGSGGGAGGAARDVAVKRRKSLMALWASSLGPLICNQRPCKIFKSPWA